MERIVLTVRLGALTLLASTTLAFAHGDVAPQPVNTDALPDVGEEWLTENPYREGTASEDVWKTAIDIGASGYNQNCARCHGLEVISGGLAPDLRFLEASEFDDEWFVERFTLGYTQGGVTKMPAFGELLGQKAGWAIRTYIETRPDDQVVGEYSDELKSIRDTLQASAEGGDAADSAVIVARLQDIAGQIDTLSGAPTADSIAFRAAQILIVDPAAQGEAAETLTIGLSASH